MMISIWCLLVICLTCEAQNRYSTHQFKKPHVFFFLGDDIGWNDVGWNNKRIHTPFMDKLAKEGVILDNYYTFTLCTPSRASLMTGYFADRLGLQRGVLMPTQPYGIPLRFKLLPERLKECKYNTYIAGKWHLGYCDLRYTPNRRGVDHWLGFYNGGEENYDHCLGYLENRTENGECTGFDFRKDYELAHQYDGQYSGEVYTKYVLDILDKHKANGPPIFMYISLTDTHFPLQPPQKYLKNCNNSVNEARKLFCGTMNAVDTAMEAIVNKLKEKRMYEDSIIIFASDNGASSSFGGSNYPLRGQKGTIYEGGARVPAFVSGPRIYRKRYVNHGLFHVADWYLTILRLARCGNKDDANSTFCDTNTYTLSTKLESDSCTEEYSDLDGLDLWDMINRNRPSRRKILPYLLDVSRDGILMAAIRDERYKLIAGSGGNNSKITHENETEDHSFDAEYMANYTDPNTLPFDLSDRELKLFDLQNDPTESRNLASEMPEKVDEMMDELELMRERSRPAMNVRFDRRGNPTNFNNSYSPGWCRPYFDVPMYATEGTNRYIYPVM